MDSSEGVSGMQAPVCFHFECIKGKHCCLKEPPARCGDLLTPYNVVQDTDEVHRVDVMCDLFERIKLDR